MSDSLTSEKRTPCPPVTIEDYCGSKIDENPSVIFQRVWNGVIVRRFDASGTHVAPIDEVVILQNIEQISDWLQQWFRATKVQK